MADEFLKIVKTVQAGGQSSSGETSAQSTQTSRFVTESCDEKSSKTARFVLNEANDDKED